MRKLLLTALVLLLVMIPLKVSYGFDAFVKSETGCFFDGNTGAFGMSMGTAQIFLTAPDKNVRIYNYTGFFHASNGDDIQGASSFMLTEKALPIGKGGLAILITIGTGVLYQIEDGEDKINADLKCELGVRFIDELQAGVGINYVPMVGEDAQFLYFSLGFSL